MVKFRKTWITAAVATAAMSSSVFGTQVQIYRDLSNYSAGSGGEFQVRVVSGNAGVLGGAATSTLVTHPGSPTVRANSFQTFCLEVNENFSPGTLYDAQLNTVVIDGQPGNNSLDGRESLAAGTAWLYERFRRGTLNGYDYDDSGVGRATTAGQLQQAIWYFQNQITLANPSGNHFVDLVDQAFGGLGSYDFGTDSGTFGFANVVFSTTNVRVLNIGMPGSGTWDRQDMLTLIPLPSGGGLAAAGLLGIVALRRRRA